MAGVSFLLREPSEDNANESPEDPMLGIETANGPSLNIYQPNGVPAEAEDTGNALDFLTNGHRELEGFGLGDAGRGFTEWMTALGGEAPESHHSTKQASTEGLESSCHAANGGAANTPSVGRDDLDGMICYGMIHEVHVKLIAEMAALRAKITSLVSSSSGSSASGIGSTQVFTLELRERVHCDRIMLLLPDHTEVGYLRDSMTRPLGQLLKISAFLVEAVTSRGRLLETIDRAIRAADALLSVDINIYGPKNRAEEVGRELSSVKLWLQRPDRFRSELPYGNPHLIRFPGFEAQIQDVHLRNDESIPKPRNKEERLQQMMSEVHNSLHRVDDMSLYTPTTITGQETTTRGTLSTTKTSLESLSESAHSKRKPPAALTVTGSIEEGVEERSGVSDQNENVEEARACDAQSFSTVSRYLTPKQRDDIIEVICKAIKNGMPPMDKAIGPVNSHPDLRDEIASSVCAFAKTMRTKVVERFDRIGSNIVGRLRSQIASRCQDILLQNDRAEETSRSRPAVVEQLESMPEMMGEERVLQWQMPMGSCMPARIQEVSTGLASPHQGLDEIPPPEEETESLTSTFSRPDEESDVDCHSLEIYGINPREVIDRFVSDPAFMVLVSDIRDLVGRYDGDKMAWIRQRVSLAMRRYHDTSRKKTEPLKAIFHVDWDLEQYLQSNYDENSGQNLENMATIVGLLSDAQCCSVCQYFNQVWSTRSSQLLRVVQAALDRHSSSEIRDLGVPSLANHPERIYVDISSNTISVEGSEDFIVVVAQQVAWLAAACCESRDGIRYAYTGIKELPELTKDRVPQFRIDVKVERPPPDCTANCWNGIVGSKVLITGFPVLKRQHFERGLEIPPFLMASLAGIPLAVSFGGGFIFKGRFHAFVPIKEVGGSVQWHVIDTYPKRLRWEDIDKHCPQRLLHEGDQEKLWNARSFFGWAPSILCLLATKEFPFDSYQYSSATKPSRIPSVELASLKMGFNQWGTAEAEIKFGKRDGLRQDQRADDYDGMLDDAKEIHIILHGTKDLRAVQSDAEEMILHILLHQQHSGRLLDSQTAKLVSADPSRQATSVREAMLHNADEIVRRPIKIHERGRKEVLFKEDAVRLYTILDALQANLHFKRGSLLRLDSHRSREVHGWEYMDLANNRPQILQRRLQLRQTCGEWHKYAKGINAIPLFVENVGDIMMPENPAQLCSALQQLPRDKCYLAVRGSTISDLFSRQGSLSDQTRLTESGHRLFGRAPIFEPCPYASRRPQGPQPCPCQRVQRIIKNLKIRRRFIKGSIWMDCTAVKTFPERSALIIGSDTQMRTSTGSPEISFDDESADEISRPAANSTFSAQEPMLPERQSALGSDGSTVGSIDAASDSLFSAAVPHTATARTGTASGNSTSRTLGSLHSQPTGNSPPQSNVCSSSGNLECLASCCVTAEAFALPLNSNGQLSAQRDTAAVAETQGVKRTKRKYSVFSRR